jgi:hypothetical protein
VIRSILPSYGIIGSDISFTYIFGNWDSRNSSSFYSNIIATSSLFPLIADMVDRALGEVYFKAV